MELNCCSLLTGIGMLAFGAFWFGYFLGAGWERKAANKRSNFFNRLAREKVSVRQ